MSCALWLAKSGLRPIIIERAAALGGLARQNPYPNEWLLGRPGETGRDNAEAFVRHIRQAGIECRLETQPVAARRRADGTFELGLTASAGGAVQPLSCPAIVLATGTKFRGQSWLDAVPNARSLAERGRVHIGPTWAGEPDAELGTHVAVIGGGDNAFDVSRILAEKGVKASIVVRSPTPKAQPWLVERLRAHQASGIARVMAGKTVTALEPANAGVRVRLSEGGTLDVDHVLLLFGYQPNTDEPWLKELALTLDKDGYVIVDGNMETSCRGVFAVGDVANPAHPCVATAIGTGTMAGREIQRRFAVKR
jgi:thioredoxin reductase